MLSDIYKLAAGCTGCGVSAVATAGSGVALLVSGVVIAVGRFAIGTQYF